MKICRLILLALLLASASIDFVKGAVEISPSRVAPVCQVGDQLELTCTSSGMLQTWRFPAIPESGRTIQSTGSSGVDPRALTINTTIMVTFSRLSTQNSLPLMSRMLINRVSKGLNGTEVECVNIVTSEVATTTIHIIGDIQNPNLSIQSHPEQFLSDRVIIHLQWTLSNSLSYYQQLLQNVSVTVVPDLEVAITYIGNMSIQLTLPYNTLYNVSVTQPGICGQPNQTVFIELIYNKCSDPLTLADIKVIAVGYEDPALEGENIMFACPPGLIFSGANSSTCMGNGEWEPDPREVHCTGGLVTAATCSNPLYVLQINDSIATVKESPKLETDVCCSGFLITRTNTTTCLENGEWELETTWEKREGTPDPVIAMLKIALISITCVLIVMSALVFIIGLLCGYYFSQRYKKSKKESSSNPTTERAEDLELKENVAYITVHPK